MREPLRHPMPFINTNNPRVSCPVCGSLLTFTPKQLAQILSPPRGKGQHIVVTCECGQPWGFDNFPQARLKKRIGKVKS